MFCGKCGSPIKDGNSFCSNCGAPISDSLDLSSTQPDAKPTQTVPVVMMTQPVPAKSANGVAIAGFILGLISFILCWVPGLGMILGIVGLVLSIVGSKRKNVCGSGGVLAGLGIVFSIIGTFGLILTLGINTYTRKAQLAESRAAASQASMESTKSDVDLEIERQLG